MVERSWFWGGTTVGDAANAGAMAGYGAPYTDDTYTDQWRKLAVYDRRYDGVINSANLVGNLQVSAPGGNVVRIAPGYALVDGKMYESTANYDEALADGSYTVVLRKVWATQTVRAIHDRAQAAALTWVDGTTWEIPLADVTLAGGAVTYLKDRRSFLKSSGTMVKIAETIVQDAAGELITFTNIPGVFKDLVYRGVGGVTANGGGLAFANGSMTFNGDINAANYWYGYQWWAAGGGVMTVASWYSGTGPANLGGYFGMFAPANRTLPNNGAFEGTIFDYASSLTEKSWLAKGWVRHAGNQIYMPIFGTWLSAAPITSIALQSETNVGSGDYNFRQYTRVSLYGVL